MSDVVETTDGKVQGIASGGVATFKGIRYANSPVAEFRFAAPPPVVPWRGVRRALNFGPTCPAVTDPPRDASESVFLRLMPRGMPTDALEDCLRLNIWAPRDLSGKQPVMVWLHAGGFDAGSAQGYLAADGAALAERRGVVVVSINNRIGPLGHTDLRPLGEEEMLGDSGNAGMLDVVAALRWVRANIAAFGGDPDRVTLFGQSGGGFKISVLLAMPQASALFHAAIIQSGARLVVHDPEASARLTRALLIALDLSPGVDALRRLRAMPVDMLLRAGRSAIDAIMRQRLPARLWQPGQWAPTHWTYEPTIGTPALPDHPGSRAAMARWATLPVICGTTRNEISPSGNVPELEALGWDGLAERVFSELGPRTATAIAGARATNPHWTPVDVLSVIATRDFRLQAVEFCDRAAQAGNARVYNYVFDWQTPLFGGRPRAFHSSEVPFVFDTIDRVGQRTGPDAVALATEMSGRWAAMAHTGHPNIAGAPTWPAFDRKRKATLLFDRQVAVRAAPDAPLLVALGG